VLALAGVTLLLASCGFSDPTQSTLGGLGGPIAEKQKGLFLGVFWVAVAVFILVEGGIVLIMLRYRHRKGQDRVPPQMHGHTRLEIGWTILPTIVLAGVMVPTVALLWDLARDPGPNALQVTVEGHQWWWGFEYPDLKTTYGEQLPVVTADVLVIPEDRDVWLTLVTKGGGAADDEGVPDFEVIHSFWVPELAGKQDVVPGRSNHLLLHASEPGVYEGQCAEFCGLQHTRMRLRVVAMTPDEWNAWVQHQQSAAVAPTDEQAARGLDIFMNGPASGAASCTSCHSIGEVAPGGDAAPNLTHYADPTHSCFAGCTWETSDLEALRTWLRDPGAARLGSKMPDYQLTEEEIDDLIALLMSLE
jgi:cytochrome c oxidase subunit 2